MKDNYALAVYAYLKDQEVEIYCGDTGETHQFSETEVTKKNIIRGTIIDARGDCLVVKVVKGNLYATMYINGWSIKAVVPLQDPLFIMDVYMDEAYPVKGRQ
jgi:hypothetical protein